MVKPSTLDGWGVIMACSHVPAWPGVEVAGSGVEVVVGSSGSMAFEVWKVIMERQKMASVVPAGSISGPQLPVKSSLLFLLPIATYWGSKSSELTR